MDTFFEVKPKPYTVIILPLISLMVWFALNAVVIARTFRSIRLLPPPLI